MEEQARVRCGIYMAAKKRPKFDSFVEYASSQGVEFVDLDLEDDASTDPPTNLHAILHKITDDVANMDTDASARNRVGNLAKIVAANPAARVVDKVEGLGPLLSRTDMQRVLEAATAECKGSVGVPKWLATDCKVLPAALEADLAAHSMAPPYLCKYQDACGIANAHDMAVLHSAAQLSALPISAPVTMQEYINHGGILWKVYVIGDKHYIVKRRSLPDMNGEEEPLLFNSHRMQDIVAEESEDGSPAPDLDIVGTFCAAVARNLDLSLFGVDILRENGSGRLFAVDVNYFPGYDGVPGFHALLLAHVLGPPSPTPPPGQPLEPFSSGAGLNGPASGRAEGSASASEKNNGSASGREDGPASGREGGPASGRALEPFSGGAGGGDSDLPEGPAAGLQE